MAILIKEGAIQIQYHQEEVEYNNNCLPSGESNFGQALKSSNKSLGFMHAQRSIHICMDELNTVTRT